MHQTRIAGALLCFTAHGLRRRAVVSLTRVFGEGRTFAWHFFLFALKFKYLLFELDFSIVLKVVPISGGAFLAHLYVKLRTRGTAA